MEIYLDKRAVRQIRLSAADAMDEGDYDTLREDIMDALSEEQLEEIERRIDGGDFYDLLSEILDEWAGEDADELFELLEAQLAEASIDLKYQAADVDDDDEVDDDDDDLDEDEEFSLSDDEDL